MGNILARMPVAEVSSQGSGSGVGKGPEGTFAGSQWRRGHVLRQSGMSTGAQAHG